MYRIQKRLMSPDVIEKNISTDPKKPIWKVYIAPIGNRNDNIAHSIMEELNSKEAQWEEEKKRLRRIIEKYKNGTI